MQNDLVAYERAAVGAFENEAYKPVDNNIATQEPL